MELSSADEEVLGRGSKRQKYRTNRKRLQHASYFAISRVIEHSDDQMGRPSNCGWHREDADEEFGVLGVVPLCDSVGIFPEIMGATWIQHGLANLAYQAFD